MAIKSNLGEIRRAGQSLAGALNLRGKSPHGKRLGDEAADTLAVGIVERTESRQVDPDGGRLKALKPATVRRKARKGQPATIGVATGQMLDLEEVRGQVVVTADRLVMTYGLDEDARAKASHFEDGGRTFYGLDPTVEKSLDMLAQETIDGTVKRLGG